MKSYCLQDLYKGATVELFEDSKEFCNMDVEILKLDYPSSVYESIQFTTTNSIMKSPVHETEMHQFTRKIRNILVTRDLRIYLARKDIIHGKAQCSD